MGVIPSSDNKMEDKRSRKSNRESLEVKHIKRYHRSLRRKSRKENQNAKDFSESLNTTSKDSSPTRSPTSSSSALKSASPNHPPKSENLKAVSKTESPILQCKDKQNQKLSEPSKSRAESPKPTTQAASSIQNTKTKDASPNPRT